MTPFVAALSIKRIALLKLASMFSLSPSASDASNLLMAVFTEDFRDVLRSVRTLAILALFSADLIFATLSPPYTAKFSQI